jgi:hypothetical protein
MLRDADSGYRLSVSLKSDKALTFVLIRLLPDHGTSFEGNPGADLTHGVNGARISTPWRRLGSSACRNTHVIGEGRVDGEAMAQAAAGC